jgi:uncharacterized protein YjcR
MARARNPQREAAMKRWLDSSGTMKNRENAALAGTSESQIRKWKSMDNWAAALGSRGVHGGTGNSNSKGNGAPERNQNAATHGAYTTMYLDDLTPDCKEYVQGIGSNSEDNMLRELQLLYAKEYDLKHKIHALENEPTGVLHIERCTVSESDKGGKTTTEESASAFEHIMRLEAELNKIHGRIIKLIDSMKAYALESQRLNLEERKYQLAKQKLSGEYSVNAETGEINDNVSAEIDSVVDVIIAESGSGSEKVLGAG